jgi:iron complex outermembrane recepter protein
MKALVLPKILGVVVCGFWISNPAQADLSENDYDDFSSERPMVVSPARLKQSLADAPAAVTIITQEQLQRFGIKNVMEALRLVPGFGIDYRGDEAQVYSHAANTIPRRLNVMIDGVTYFRPAFTSVDWEALPVAIEDVDRIEVTRAPSAATYGSNSFSAVVNVISLHPTKAGSEIDAAYSTHDDARIYGRTTLHGNNTSVRISAEVANARGFDRINDTKSRADTSFSKLNVRSVSQLGERDQIEMLGTLTKGERQILSIEKRQTSYPDIDVSDIALSAQWVRDLDDHQLKTHINYFHAVRTQEWSTCQPAATFLPEAANLWLINHDYVLALLGGSTPRGGGAEADAALRGAVVANGAIRFLGDQQYMRRYRSKLLRNHNRFGAAGHLASS